MGFWASFTKNCSFREIRYFDIQGEYTGLTSKAMTAPDGRSASPLNEGVRRGRRSDRRILMRVQRRGISTSR